MQLRWRRASTPSGPWRSFALPAAAGLFQPGSDRRQQPRRLLAPRQQEGGNAHAGFGFEHQQHPPGAAERGRLGDQPLADRGLSGRAG